MKLERRGRGGRTGSGWAIPRGPRKAASTVVMFWGSCCSTRAYRTYVSIRARATMRFPEAGTSCCMRTGPPTPLPDQNQPRPAFPTLLCCSTSPRGTPSQNEARPSFPTELSCNTSPLAAKHLHMRLPITTAHAPPSQPSCPAVQLHLDAPSERSTPLLSIWSGVAVQLTCCVHIHALQGGQVQLYRRSPHQKMAFLTHHPASQPSISRGKSFLSPTYGPYAFLAQAQVDSSA